MEEDTDIVKKLVEAVIGAVRPLLGENVRQADLAAALGENASSLSRLQRGDNSSATKPLNWITHWNKSHPEQRLFLAYDGEEVAIRVGAPAKKRRGEATPD